MAPTGQAYKVDWIFSNTSNVHVAKHRDWFTEFTEFKSKLIDGQEIQGVGNVELEVKIDINRTGRHTHRKLLLKNVVYIPTAVCNILARPILKQCNYGNDSTGGYLKDKKTGALVGIFDGTRLLKLWLVGHRKGETSLDPNTLYWINAQWDENEQLRWLRDDQDEIVVNVFGFKVSEPEPETEKHRQVKSKKSTSKRHPSQQPTGAQKSVPEYTAAEKAWLKRAFRGEFKFLSEYGLSIYKDEHREKGRSIARALIQEEALRDSEDEGDSEKDSFLQDLKDDPSSHFADHYFKQAQLEFIQKHYRHTGNFLITHGLKFYDDDHCQKAVAIARAFMSGDH